MRIDYKPSLVEVVKSEQFLPCRGHNGVFSSSLDGVLLFFGETFAIEGGSCKDKQKSVVKYKIIVPNIKDSDPLRRSLASRL